MAQRPLKSTTPSFGSAKLTAVALGLDCRWLNASSSATMAQSELPGSWVKALRSGGTYPPSNPALRRVQRLLSRPPQPDGAPRFSNGTKGLSGATAATHSRKQGLPGFGVQRPGALAPSRLCAGHRRDGQLMHAHANDVGNGGRRLSRTPHLDDLPCMRSQNLRRDAAQHPPFALVIEQDVMGGCRRPFGTHECAP